MRETVKITFLLWFALSVLIAFSFFHQISKDRKFKEEKLLAPKEFIDSYKDSHGRIPTKEEFNARYYDSDNMDYRISNFKLRKYTIRVWRGEWYESYNSENNIFENENSKMGLIKTGSIILIIGCIPIILFSYFTKKN